MSENQLLNGYANGITPNEFLAKPIIIKKAAKLSKTQKELIKEMQNGVICHYLQGLNARCFLARTGKNISWATIFKLEHLGLIKRNDNSVSLTDYGRNYII